MKLWRQIVWYHLEIDVVQYIVDQTQIKQREHFDYVFFLIQLKHVFERADEGIAQHRCPACHFISL